MVDLSLKTSNDEAICERILSLKDKMQSRTFTWAEINTGSWNKAGLDKLAPQLADAFSVLEADIELIDTEIGAPLDKEVQKVISETAKKVSVITAIAPGPFIDMAAVTLLNLNMISPKK